MKIIMSETLASSALIRLAVALVGTLVKCELVNVKEPMSMGHPSVALKHFIYRPTDLHINVYIIYRGIVMLHVCPSTSGSRGTHNAATLSTVQRTLLAAFIESYYFKHTLGVVFYSLPKKVRSKT